MGVRGVLGGGSSDPDIIYDTEGTPCGENPPFQNECRVYVTYDGLLAFQITVRDSYIKVNFNLRSLRYGRLTCIDAPYIPLQFKGKNYLEPQEGGMFGPTSTATPFEGNQPPRNPPSPFKKSYDTEVPGDISLGGGSRDRVPPPNLREYTLEGLEKETPGIDIRHMTSNQPVYGSKDANFSKAYLHEPNTVYISPEGRPYSLSDGYRGFKTNEDYEINFVGIFPWNLTVSYFCGNCQQPFSIPKDVVPKFFEVEVEALMLMAGHPAYIPPCYLPGTVPLPPISTATSEDKKNLKNALDKIKDSLNELPLLTFAPNLSQTLVLPGGIEYEAKITGNKDVNGGEAESYKRLIDLIKDEIKSDTDAILSTQSAQDSLFGKIQQELSNNLLNQIFQYEPVSCDSLINIGFNNNIRDSYKRACEAAIKECQYDSDEINDPPSYPHGTPLSNDSSTIDQ